MARGAGLWQTEPVSGRRLAPLAVLVFLAGAFVAGHHLRGHLPAELTPRSIHDWVVGLGWTGALVYLGVLVFRQFLLLPAALVLPVGGLCFGALLGTLLGAIGLILSALMKFALARTVGRDWVRPHLGARLRALEARVDRVGPVLIGMSTAHPAGPLSPLHWAAGLSSLPPAAFAGAVVLGAPVRAFAYAFFGSTLLDPGSAGFITASALLGVSILVPIVYAALRR